MATAPGLGPLEMSVLAGDGLVLKGVLEYPEPPGAGRQRWPLAVLAHQYPATSDSYAPLVEDLLEMGVATLAFDLRGHGSSIAGPDGPRVVDTPAGFSPDDFGRAFMSSIARLEFNRIDDDIVRVAAWGAVQNFIDAGRILLVGSSVGGSGALLAAPKISGLAAVITLGAAGAPAWDNGPNRIRRELEQLGTPCLLTSSEGDPFEGGSNVTTWSEGLQHVTAKLVPGSDHGMAIYYDVRDDVLGFVKRVMRL
ncbi:MAG: alpha/beta fold hydrolase [Gemmatimonadota bacterium]|nr:alpha/beta fold hydrolase [Gemmatimonadota bacterium]